MNEPLIEARTLSKTYQMGDYAVDVLKNISLSVREGDMVGIFGPSGAGKSTLLHMLGLLDTPTSGEVYYSGQPTAVISDGARARLRNRDIGFVFQFYHLLPDFNALENVLTPAFVGRGVVTWLREKAGLRDRAADLLTRLGLAERMRHTPNQLSGGERQRVAIARALINAPRLLLCDEPTGNLDRRTGAEILDLLAALNAGGQTIVVVSHNMNVAELCGRTIHLEDGCVATTHENGHMGNNTENQHTE